MFAVNAILKNRLNIKKKRLVLHAIHEQISVVECDADVHTKTLSLPAERGLVDLLGTLRMEHDLLLDVGVLKKMASMQPSDVAVPKLEFVEKDSLDVIVSCCRSMRAWIQEDSRNRAVVLCSSPALRVRIATCLLIFLKTLVSNELALEHYYRVCYKTGFFNISPSVACSPPSLLRLLKDFSRMMRKNEKFEVPKLFLDQIIIHKLPSFDVKKGTHLMLTVLQDQRFLYSSMLQGGGVKWIKSCTKRPSTHAVQLHIPIEGEVMIKAYHIPQKMRTHTPRIPIFEIAFHSATQCGRRSVTYRRHEIDNCKVYPGDIDGTDCSDRQIYHRKFRVELCFTDEPQNSDDEVSSASAVDEDEDDDDDDDDDEDDVVSSASHTPSASTPVGGGFSGCGSCEQCISHQEEVKRALVAAAATAASASPTAASAFICPYIVGGHATHVFHHHEHSHQHEHEHLVELKEPPPPPAKPAAVVAASAPTGGDDSTPVETPTSDAATSNDAGARSGDAATSGDAGTRSGDADGADAASGDGDVDADAESVAGGSEAGAERPPSPDRHVAQEPDPISTPCPPVSSNARDRRHHRSKTGTAITLTSPSATSSSSPTSSPSSVTTQQHRSVSSRSHRHHHHSSSRHRSSRHHHSSQHGSHRSSSSRHRSSRHHTSGGYSSATLPLRRHATDGGGGKSLHSSSGGRERRNSIQRQISSDEMLARELQQQLNSRSSRSVSGRTATSLLGALVNAATSGVDLITSHASGNSSNSRNNRSSSRTPPHTTSSTVRPARAITITEESDPLPIGSSESTPTTEAEQRIQYFVDAMVSSGMTSAPPISSSPQLPARNSQQPSSSLVDHDRVFARMLQQRFMEEEVDGDSPSFGAQSASPAASPSPLVASAASGDEPAAADGTLPSPLLQQSLSDVISGSSTAPLAQRGGESSRSHRRHQSGSRALTSSAMPAGQPNGSDGLDARAASQPVPLSTHEEDEDALLQEYMGFGRRRHRAGASSHSIRSLPAFRVKADSSYLKDDRECMICRQGFEESEILRTLPCIHAYHKHCVDQWLRINKKCPVCHTKIDDPMFSGAP